MSQDIGIARTYGCGFGLIAFGCWAGWSSGAVVVAGRADDQVAGVGSRPDVVSCPVDKYIDGGHDNCVDAQGRYANSMADLRLAQAATSPQVHNHGHHRRGVRLGSGAGGRDERSIFPCGPPDTS